MPFGKLLLVLYFSQSGKPSIPWEVVSEKAYLCILNTDYMRRERSSTCFNDTACRVYNISYDGGSKYLRTMFVGSRVRGYARVRACVCRLRQNYPTMTTRGEEY